MPLRERWTAPVAPLPLSKTPPVPDVSKDAQSGQTVNTGGRAEADPAELVRAAQSGDRRAFGELYMRYAGIVRSIAAARLPIDEVADAVQEVFLRALRKLVALRDARRFGAWLAAIARNTVHDLQKDASASVGVEQEPASRETQLDQIAARAAVRAIRRLPAAYRNTVRMRVVEGMTGPEIAVRTGMSPASVRVNLHRGLKILRQRLLTSTRRTKHAA
jgi:RNA polymerase sigma-70 factor (ECF subfamily)